MVYTLRFFPSKCRLFHNSNVFGSCFIHILYTGVLKLKKNNSGAKRLMHCFTSVEVYSRMYLERVRLNRFLETKHREYNGVAGFFFFF